MMIMMMMMMMIGAPDWRRLQAALIEHRLQAALIGALAHWRIGDGCSLSRPAPSHRAPPMRGARCYGRRLQAALMNARKRR